jgi:hypothetical protein
MTLAHPWAFALAALAAPVIVMYLYRMHRARKPVSSAILLRLIRDDRPATRNARSRLRHKVSVALVLAALVLAIIALAGPKIGGGRASRVVIIFDRSASMGARDPSARLVAASDEVSAVVDRANDGDEIALIAAGGEPGVVVAPTRSHAEIEAGAAAIRETGGASEAALLDVLDLAAVADFFQSRPAFHVLVNNAGTNRPMPMSDVGPTRSLSVISPGAPPFSACPMVRCLRSKR